MLSEEEIRSALKNFIVPPKDVYDLYYRLKLESAASGMKYNATIRENFFLLFDIFCKTPPDNQKLRNEVIGTAIDIALGVLFIHEFSEFLMNVYKSDYATETDKITVLNTLTAKRKDNGFSFLNQRYVIFFLATVIEMSNVPPTVLVHIRTYINKDPVGNLCNLRLHSQDEYTICCIKKLKLLVDEKECVAKVEQALKRMLTAPKTSLDYSEDKEDEIFYHKFQKGASVSDEKLEVKSQHSYTSKVFKKNNHDNIEGDNDNNIEGDKNTKALWTEHIAAEDFKTEDFKTEIINKN